MIDLYFWTTPNGYKPLLFLEETGIRHRIVPINISKGEQFDPAFLTISPNNRIPAIVDHDPAEGASPISIFESGAILQYLAEKTGKFLPVDVAGRAEVMQWLFWQMGGAGLKDGNRRCAFLRIVVDDSGDAVVGRDREKGWIELLARADVDRDDAVANPSLFQE